MEKIKETIDLKELEKYGYEKKNAMYVKYTNDTYYGSPIAITINAYTRIIEKRYCWTYMFGPILHSSIMRNNKPVKVNKKYIQDLIQAGYIEEAK